MPIYVESLIRAPIGEIWQKTQDPHCHTEWDLRFSEISYLPRADETEPQRFLYRTRLGFGVAIAGEGESVGRQETSSGERMSALRFWSADPKSLIEDGSGYWKYTPEENGVRFVTLYDYRTRFGLAGQVFDRLVFRPLMAWATAWSFDRLRLWLEERIDPATSLERALLHAVSRWTLALIWIYQGIVPKLLFQNSGELNIVRATRLAVGHESELLSAIGVAEMIFGLLHLFPWRSRVVLKIDSPLLILLLIGGLFSGASILVAPFNAVTLTLAMIALAVIGLVTGRNLPSARNTRWSSRGRRA
jgi:DoxX-like family